MKIGDIIRTEEDAAGLPIGTIVFDLFGIATQKDADNLWLTVGSQHYHVDKTDADISRECYEIIYLPKKEG